MKDVYNGKKVLIDGFTYSIVACMDKTGKAQDCLLINDITYEEIEAFITKEMIL